MHHSICTRRIVGEEHTHVNPVLFSECMYSFTMYMQAMNRRRIVLYYKLHGQLWEKNVSEYGHSLGGQREILFHDGCIPKAPHISHISSHGEMTWTTSKWWGNHLPHLDLM